MRESLICLDVGGTEIKAAAVGRDGMLLDGIQYFPADSHAPAGRILDHIAKIIRTVSPQDAAVAGVHFAFPGPFDYERGISLMQGQDKYEALYGLDLRGAMQRRLPGLKGETIRFVNDVSAFALGEMHFGRFKALRKVMFLCIGTGCGSAFGVEGRLADESVPGVPPRGYVYPTPFLDSCIDDEISRRGLMRLTEQILGEPLDGYALACRIQAGDAKAERCFLMFGERLRDAAALFLPAFRPEGLCIGGQITKSAKLFLPPLAAYCRDQGVHLWVTEDTSEMALRGLSLLEQAE